ncbi:Gfo/Idh/MocA family protein [Microlunatus soli]|uniref:Predicted dehydrogenase n=1 Tax=Microlunatus soli TaxID=630515 RepID=A0A1H1XC88_9ACTN|nr:Gfo/Idh/MocA family oxidoreductase [Microlunatus soli]SDT06750.1 Predicted dehydrogenase [Microlunatus soli]
MAAKSGPIGVGIIGAGTISQTYLENLTSFPDVEVLAIGDIITEAADAKASEFGIEAHGGPEAVLGHDGVEMVVNLTIPAVHAEVALQAIEAGKHVFNEKPLSLDRVAAKGLLDAADKAGLRVGCAPDTFLGTGLQETRKIIERGDIGEPLTALTLMQSPGPESWHPNPAFLFQEGAGPLFDIGPYYFTALVQLFGAVEQVAAVGSKSREQRIIGSGPKAGEKFDVTVPTHVSASARFASGQSSQTILSFDSAARRILFEVNGSEGTIAVPDPNTFAGEIKIIGRTDEDWKTVATTEETSSRGTGALDMARAIREDRPHRATGAQAYHVLDIMESVAEAATSGDNVKLDSTFDRPELLPDDWDAKAKTL